MVRLPNLGAHGALLGYALSVCFAMKSPAQQPPPRESSSTTSDLRPGGGSATRASASGAPATDGGEPAPGSESVPPPAAESESRAKSDAEWSAPPRSDPDRERADAVRRQVLRLLPEDRHFRAFAADLVAKAYRERGFRPLWEDPPAIHRPLARQLAAHAFPEKMALDPAALAPRLGEVAVEKTDLATTVAIVDAGLLVRLGAVAPDRLWPRWNEGDVPGEDGTSLEALVGELILAASVRPFDLARIIATLQPENWIYAELRDAYPEAKGAVLEYSGLPQIPDPDTAGIGRPGETFSYAPAVAAHLADRGYLQVPEEQWAALSRVTPALEEAILAFQEDYGLETDGIFGPSTWRQLNTNAADRYRSITLNLHRARLLPDSFGERYLIANLPGAELYAFEANDFHAHTMRLVHGKAENDGHHTPVFRDVMQRVVFGPYWNVPRNIAVDEILPKAREDWGFLGRNRYEIVGDFDPSNRGSYRLSPRNLDLVARGRLFLRQKPGPENSLGRVKFLFPNSYSIYLHDTPSKHLFTRAERDYSHGCMRVEKPAKLGEWVLRSQQWTRGGVEEAMHANARKSVAVKADINVFVTYFTTFPRPVPEGDIVLARARDVYGLDTAHSKILSAVVPWTEPTKRAVPTARSGGR